MTNRVPPGRITYDDDPVGIRRRINRAYTGGRGTLEEQREMGGNPDPRVCSVSSLHAFYATPDPKEYGELQTRCRAGELLCGECKTYAADRLLEYLEGHRDRRDAPPPDAITRAEDLAGFLDTEGPG